MYENGIGYHLIVDFFEAENLTNQDYIKQVLKESSLATGATILEIKTHHFGTNNGITGFAMLAESHISIHTWPENNYAALDIFVCGKCDPNLAIPIIKKAFKPKQVKISEIKRGVHVKQ